jgi:hypothetical protein
MRKQVLAPAPKSSIRRLRRLGLRRRWQWHLLCQHPPTISAAAPRQIPRCRPAWTWCRMASPGALSPPGRLRLQGCAERHAITRATVSATTVAQARSTVNAALVPSYRLHRLWRPRPLPATSTNGNAAVAATPATVSRATLGGQVELPPAVKQLLSLFAIVISFGLNGISSVLECLGMRGYVSTLAFHTAAPLFLALLVLLAALGRMLNMRRFTAEALLETAVPALLKLAFLAYPLVATVAFRKRRALIRSNARSATPVPALASIIQASMIAFGSRRRCLLVLPVH